MSEPVPVIAGLLLAGGRGQRFDALGQKNKLLERLPEGTTVALASAGALLAALGGVLAVIRPGQEVLRGQLEQAGCQVKVAPRAAEGMGATLVSGIESLQGADGWIIALADMPWVRVETIRALADAIRQGADIAVPVQAGKRGNPVGFSSRHRNALLGLSGDEGARALLRSATVTMVEVDDPGIHRDVDTPADLA